MARKSRKVKAAPEVIPSKRYRTAIYARLSGKGRTEETIDAQIRLVREYLRNKPAFDIVEVFADDGYSGTNWDRPSFQKMMDAVRSGAVDCIVVKDLSRFAREHIGAEDYLNNIFPFLGVRFIAVTDGYDNIHIEPQEYFLASFKNLAHAYFAQETSRKISMSLRVVQENGLYIGSRAPFGYDLDPDQPHKLHIHAEQAAIVREIFERVVSGETYTEISETLNRRFPDGTVWTNPRIGLIVHRELYIGTVIGHKTEQALYKGETRHKIPKNEQIRVENAAPAIISRELWNKAHESLEKRKIRLPMDTNPFKGIAFCALCDREIMPAHDRKRRDFIFHCKYCKCGVYCSGSALLAMTADKLSLDTDVTEDIVQERLSRIVIRDRKHVTLLDKEGHAL